MLSTVKQRLKEKNLIAVYFLVYLFWGTLFSVLFEPCYQLYIQFILALLMTCYVILTNKYYFKTYFINEADYIYKHTLIPTLLVVGLTIVNVVTSTLNKVLVNDVFVNDSSILMYMQSNALLTGVTVIVLIPIIEEFVFKKALYFESHFLKKQNKIKLFVCASLFATIHCIGSITNFNMTIFINCIYYVLFYVITVHFSKKYDNFLLSILVHVMLNLITFLACL